MSRLAAYLSDLQRFGIAPGLERIQALLARADNPQLQYPHILIGGTNGKGSTAEFSARTLAQNGRRIGLYTSPHLYHWNERIRILPGQGLFEGAISDEDLDDLLDDALPHIAATSREWGQPTEFEVMTFLGLWHFARQNVDAAVLEVGLGGKWDATNATDPEISAVTHVALDHCDRLGDTLEEIAADKVCIARAGRPFYTTETKPEVRKVFKDYCAQIGAQLICADGGHDEFQKSNAFLAVNLARSLAIKLGWEMPSARDFKLKIAGRFETIARKPRVIIDGANNPDGAAHLAQEIKKLAIQNENLVLVLGILADKDWRAMIEILAPLARLVICTRSDSPRALPVADLAQETRKYTANVEEAQTVEAAVARARDVAASGDTILVTGSFTTIAQVPRHETL